MIRAVLFDLDGTLYHQPPLRLLMAAELGVVPWFRHAPWEVSRVWRTLSVFRRVREELRALGRPELPLDRLQYTQAAERAGVPVGDLEATIDEWIYRRPLKYLPRVMRRGMADVLSGLQARGLKVGVFSDYPVGEKLEAMGLRALISLELEATAEKVNAFKPHPRGFEVACCQWSLPSREVLYVGDRPEVDARGAAMAAMPCAIIGSAGGAEPAEWPHTRLRHVRDLLDHIDRQKGAD